MGERSGTKRDAIRAEVLRAEVLRAEVLIVGGGLVGGVLACALGQAGLKAVVVDREATPTTLEDRFDGRAFAIAYATRRLLEGIGVWPRVAEATPMLEIRVADGDSLLFLHYDYREVGDEPFGHMVEARHIRRALAARLAELPSVTVLAPARTSAIARDEGGIEARLADGRGVRASLVVAADGRGSRLRAEAGIRITRLGYGQHAIVCTVAHEHPHGFIAHEHFLPAGPFAILPLAGNRSSLVWTERAELASAIVALPEDEFLAELGQRFGDFLGRLALEGPRWSYPLSLEFAHQAVARRLALVGDALHAIHPIAGQGLNLGLRDAAALAETVVDARRLGFDPGSGAVLADYQRWRRFDSAAMIAVTDSLNRLFSNAIAPLRLARDLGLALVNEMPPLKRLFMRAAMGTVGELPRLLRGEAL